MAGFRLVMESLSRLSGLHVCLHDLTGFTRSEGRGLLPRSLMLHWHPFCRAAKRRPGGEKRCLSDCAVAANRRAAEVRRPFIKRCHAGAVEVVVPVMLGGRHAGTLFAGPTAARAADCRCGMPARPMRTRAELLELGRLLSVITVFAAEAGQALQLRRIEEGARSEPVRLALRFAAERCCEPVTVADAARDAYLSPSRFAHLFSEETGVPFHRYLNALRLDRARSLLAHSSLKIAEVAAQCGFCNQNYFAEVFRRAAGCTPSRFRQEKRASLES
jgi:AraC-like DNA-binding protein